MTGHPYSATLCLLREESLVSAQILTSPLITTEASETPVIFKLQCEGVWLRDVISREQKTR